MVYQCNRLPNLVFPRITQIARIKFLAMEAILVSGSVHLRLFSCRFVHLAGSKCVGTSLVLGMKQRINQPSCVDGWPQTAPDFASANFCGWFLDGLLLELTKSSVSCST